MKRLFPPGDPGKAKTEAIIMRNLIVNRAPIIYLKKTKIVKKQVQLIITIIVLLASLTGYGQQQNVGDSITVAKDNMTYKITSTTEKTVEVVDYNVTRISVSARIPSTVEHGQDTYTVTSIGEGAFRQKGLRSVIIPNTVTNIGVSAFENNWHLTSIRFSAFYRTRLTEVAIPPSVNSIANWAFRNNPITSILALGSTPPNIGFSTFSGRRQIDVLVPKGKTEDYQAGGWTGFKSIKEGIEVSIDNAPAQKNDLAPFSVTITFKHDVTGFTQQDITDNLVNATVVDGSFSLVTGSTSAYTVELTPTVCEDTITIDIPEGVAEYALNFPNFPNLAASTTVTVNARPEAPSVNSASVEYCQEDDAGALTATGDNLRWYTSQAGGRGETTAPIPGTANAGSTTHYVSQTTNGCESARTPIEVKVNALPQAPTISSTSSPICAGNNAIFTITGGTPGDVVTYEDGISTSPQMVPLEEGGSVQVTVSGVSPEVTLTLTNITRGNCSIPLATTTATVMVNARPEAPSVNSASVEYCQEDDAGALTATGDNLRWYTSQAGGRGETTAPIPGTANAGSTTHYVSQTTNGCESARTPIEVKVNALPEALTISSTNSSICAGDNAIFTIAGGTPGDLVTYDDGTPPNKTVPLEEGGSIQVTVSGASPEVTLKEVTRGNCSTQLTATARVTVNANPPTLTVTPGPPVCAGDNAIFTIEGGNKDDVVIYDDGTSTRTIPIRADGKATVPVNGVSSNTTLTLKEVSNENCSIELSEMATVTVNDLPVAPTVSSSPVEYCVGETATALTATGDNLLWYTSEKGGTGEATAPIPGTANAGSTTHYVSQTTNGCESERAEIVVTVVEACLVQIGDGFTVSGIGYEITSVNPNEVKVMDYTGSATAVEIPGAVDDKGETYAVTAIGANAFSDNPDLDTVKIEADHLLSIHADAFADRSQVDLVVSIGMRQAYIDAGLTGFASITEAQVVTAIHNYEFNDFTLYPNPARDKVYIDIDPRSGQELKQVNIYTMDRAYLHSENRPVINTARLPTGTYLFEIVTKKGDRSTKRVIIQ